MTELSTTDLLTMAAVASSDDLRAGLLLAAAMGTTSSEGSADGSDLSQEASSTKVAEVDEPAENLSTDFVDNHPVPEPVTREDSNKQLNEKLVEGNKPSGVPNQQLEEKVNAANLEEVKMEKDVIQEDGKTAEKLLYEEELREEDTTLVMATEGLEEDDAYEAMDASKAEEMSEKSADDFEQELREQLQRFEEEVMSNSTNEEEMKRKDDVENELERIGRDVMVISAENGEEPETKDEQEKDAVAMETDMDGTEKVAEEQLKKNKELDEIEDEDEEYSEDEYEVLSDDAQDAPEGAPPEDGPEGAPPEEAPEGAPTEDAPPVLEPESASPVTSKSAPKTSREAEMTSQVEDDDQDKVVTPSGKTMREILMENAALKTKLSNLMRDMDQRFRVTEELLQLTMIQRDKLNQLPGDDCRVVKIWNQKRREHAEVYLSPEARHMLKSGMSIVLRKKSMPNPVTINRDVSDVDSDVGDVIASTSTKKSRRGRPLPKRRQNKQESESESEKEVKVKEVMKKKPTKTNWNKINAESKAKAEKKALEEKRSLEAKRKRMEVARNMKAAKEATTKKMLEKQKKWELTRKKPEAVEMKQQVVEKKRPGRKKKIVVEKEESSMNESGSESESEDVDSESSMPKKRRGFRAKRGKITKNLTNSKTAILPKIRSARIRARATVKAMTASLRAESPVVKLSKDDIDNIDNYEKVEAKKKRGRPSEKKKEEETNEERVRKLKELKRPERPVVPPTPTPVSAKEAVKVVVGCSKRKTFTPIRKNVEKKDYISEIKELTQKKTKIEPSDIGDVLPEIKPKRPESSVLNIPLSPSKMKLLQARDALKRKLGSEDERSPERKRGKTESVQPGSARTRGRTLVSEMKTKYAETDFIEKLKELDSQNRPKAKPVPDNETSAKLSRLIDSVAGRISSPVSFSESETKEDSNSDEIPAPVEEQRTDTESPPVVPVVMHTDPTSGEPLVGPMIPLAATQIKKPQILRIEATPAPCGSTSSSILPEKDGKMASVQIRTENTEAKTQTQNVVLVRDPKDPNRTMLVRIGPKPVGSAASNVQTAQMSPGGHIRISRPGLQPATISFSKQQQNPQSSSNIRMITLSQSELGKSNLTGLLRSNPNILVSKTQGQRLVSPRIVQAPKVIYTVPKETSDSFLVGAAPTVQEPEMKKRTRPIDVSDLSTVKVHKKDDFKDQSYDSVQDLLNLMDDGSDVVQVRKASFSGDDERKEGKTVLVDSDLAVNAAQALVAMETTESGSTGEKSATVAMETGESSIPTAEEGSVDDAVFQNTGRSDLLWQLVKATIGDHFDGSEESMKSNDAISDEVPSENACQVTSGAISEDAHPNTSSQSEIPTQGVAEFGKLDENQSVKAVEQTLTTTSSTEQNVCEQIVQNMLENITVERAEMEPSEIVMIEESKEKNQESTTENTKYERFQSQESGLGLSPPDEKEIGDQNQLNCDKTVSDIDMESIAGSIGEAPEIQNPESDLEESPDVLNSDVEDEAKSIVSENKTNDDETKSESLASKETGKEMSEDGEKIDNVEEASNDDSKVMEKWTDELLDELEKELEEEEGTGEEKAEVMGIKQEVLTEEENEEILEDEEVEEENEENFLEESSGKKDIVKKEPVEVENDMAENVGNDELVREMDELVENGQVESRSVSPAEMAENENAKNSNEVKEKLDISAEIADEDSDVESPIENLFPDSDSDDSIGGECVEEEQKDKTKEVKLTRKKPERKTSISLEDISPRKAIFAPVRRQNRGTRKSQEKKEEEEKKTKRVLKINKSKARGWAKKQRSMSEDKDTTEPGDSSLRPSNPDLTISTHQVIAIIRQGRDHYSRCPRQLEVSFDHPDYQQYYSDFMAKFKNTHHHSSPGGQPRKKHQQHDSGGKRRSSECHNVLLSGDLTSP